MDARLIKLTSAFSAGAAAVALVNLQAGRDESRTAAAGQTSTVCVNKKNQTMALPKGSKCKKGWKKKTIGTTGPSGPPGAPGAAGATGPVGPDLSVKAANGEVVGKFRSYQSLGQNPAIAVARDGGVFTYGTNGRLLPQGTSYYETSNCTGQAYAVTAIAIVDDVLATVGSEARVVTRSLGLNYGTPRTLRLTSDWSGRPTTYYKLENGTCTKVGDLTIALVKYEEVPSPPDFTGPLRVE